MLFVKLNVFERFLVKLHWVLMGLSDIPMAMIVRKYNKDGIYNTWTWNAKDFNGEIIFSNETES